MFIGRVTGTVVASHKHYKLDGRKILIVQPLDLAGDRQGTPLLAVDGAHAGEGDRVLVVQEGRAASMISARDESPLDAAIVAVVDHVELS